MKPKRNELRFQGHVIDSYKHCGGHARKWATDLMVGMPDLICTLPGVGVHLAELKHRPEWAHDKEYANPLTERQQQEAVYYGKGGGLCLGLVVVGQSDAVGSRLCAFNPLKSAIATGLWVPYVAGAKYNIKQLVEDYIKCQKLTR